MRDPDRGSFGRRLQGEEEGGVWGGCDVGEGEEASLRLSGAVWSEMAK